MTNKDNEIFSQEKPDEEEKPKIKLRDVPGLIWRNVTVEPLLLLYALGFSSGQNIAQDFYQSKICEVGSEVFGNGSTWSHEVCDDLNSGNYNETQQYVLDTYQSIYSVTLYLKGIPPIIFTLFIGPWSDRFGRKKLMIIPLFGYLAYNIWFLINAIFFTQMRPEWLMFEVFQYWPGGFMCLFLGAYSYVSDQSSKEYRTLRIGIVDFIFYGGISSGYAMAGSINEKWGFIGTWTVGAIFQTLGILYGIFFIKERKKVQVQAQTDGAEKPAMTFLNVFSFKHLKSSFSVLFRWRPDGSRHFICILVLLFGMYTFASNGANNINISYIQQSFLWGDGDAFNLWYSKFSSTNTVLTVVALGILLPIATRILKLNDLVITTFCLTCYIAGLCTIMLAKDVNLLFLSSAFNMFHSLTTTTVRSALSKIIVADDIGKIFASVACTQSLIGFLTPTYNLIYEATSSFYIGTVYIVSCGILVIMLCLVVYCIWFWKVLDKRKKAEELQLAAEPATPPPSYGAISAQKRPSLQKSP